MKNRWFGVVLLSALLIFATVLVGGCAAATTVAPEILTQQAENVSALEAQTLIQDNRSNPDFVILDVRTPEEFADGHIEGAVNTDFYEGTFRNELDALDKNKTYLVFCRSGNRSQSTIDIMEELGFINIYHMTGGMIEWGAEGLPVVK